MITIEDDIRHLQRAVELATAALEAGDDPFGSLLVARDGTVLAEELNREASSGDPTAHPEFALARWATANLSAPERLASTVYTSGEHCLSTSVPRPDDRRRGRCSSRPLSVKPLSSSGLELLTSRP
jgi:hypothetical protein